MRHAGLLMFMSVVFLVLFLITASVCVERYFYFISAEAEVNQLRSDMKKLEGQSISEDVIGQATKWNQTIKGFRRLNQVPVIQLTIPNGWDDLELIEIPEK